MDFSEKQSNNQNANPVELPMPHSTPEFLRYKIDVQNAEINRLRPFEDKYTELKEEFKDFKRKKEIEELETRLAKPEKVTGLAGLGTPEIKESITNIAEIIGSVRAMIKGEDNNSSSIQGALQLDDVTDHETIALIQLCIDEIKDIEKQNIGKMIPIIKIWKQNPEQIHTILNAYTNQHKIAQ